MPHPNLTIGFFLCAVLCSKVLLSSWHESWALFFIPHLVFDVVVVCNHKMLSSSIRYLHTLDNSFKLNMGCAECGCAIRKVWKINLILMDHLFFFFTFLLVPCFAFKHRFWHDLTSWWPPTHYSFPRAFCQLYRCYEKEVWISSCLLSKDHA